MKHQSLGGGRGGPVAGLKTKQVPQKRRNNNQNAKHLKFYSSSCAKASVEPTFTKMDPSKPEHARRIQQRRRMISYGKVSKQSIKQTDKQTKTGNANFSIMMLTKKKQYFRFQ